MEVERKLMGLYARYKVMPSGLVAPGRHVHHDFQHTGDSDMGQAPHSLVNVLVHKGRNIHIGNSDVTNGANASSQREGAFYKYHNIFALNGVGRGNGSGVDVLRWTAKDNRNDQAPASSSFYAVVQVHMKAAGHTDAGGNGSKYEIASVEYNGAAPSTLNQSYPVPTGYKPRFFLNHTGYKTTDHVCGGGSGGGGFSGLFEIEILFSRGRGGTGSYILYDLEELY